jgi:hypothetical protein
MCRSAPGACACRGTRNGGRTVLASHHRHRAAGTGPTRPHYLGAIPEAIADPPPRNMKSSSESTRFRRFTASVETGETAETTFDVTCEADAGAIAVTTTTRVRARTPTDIPFRWMVGQLRRLARTQR